MADGAEKELGPVKFRTSFTPLILCGASWLETAVALVSPFRGSGVTMGVAEPEDCGGESARTATAAGFDGLYSLSRSGIGFFTILLRGTSTFSATSMTGESVCPVIGVYPV